MKICFLVPNLDKKAGWGRFSMEIVNRVSERGFDVEIVKIGKKLGRGVIFSIFKNALLVRKKIKNCDIVHCFDGFPYGIIGALSNVGINKKLVINGVGTWSVLPLYQKRYQWLLVWAYKRADRVLCISRFVRDEIKKKVNLGNLEVVNLGVDLNKFNCINSLQKKKEKIILSVGALVSRKGYHVSIPAIAEVKKIYPHIKYCVVGNQSNLEYFSELKKLVKKYDLVENIEFLNNLSDEELRDLYTISDLFILTSINDGHAFEGFGLVYLEANACGKPVIGTYGCGAEDAIKDGYNGFLVPQNNVVATAEAIIKFFGGQSLQKEMHKNALKWAKNHGWDKTVDGYLSVYKSLT
ncbi:glycosyltransferase family 4 protein [Patescibacteria group bacterium]